MAASLVTRARRLVQQTPPARQILEAGYARWFRRPDASGAFRGVHASFEEARAAAPPDQPVGYDHRGPAAMYRDRLDRVWPADYPVMFWLSRILPSAPRVFDLGGHVGVAWWAYGRYLDWPDDVRWTVCDVPAVAEAGRALAEERGEGRLAFTSEPGGGSGADVWLASGSLQYLEEPLADLLDALDEPPRHLILNKLPLHPQRAFVTVQNIGTAFCPYRVFARDAFLDALRCRGWDLVDTWDNAELGCHVPFHPGHSVPTYSGAYLRRAGV